MSDKAKAVNVSESEFEIEIDDDRPTDHDWTEIAYNITQEAENVWERSVASPVIPSMKVRVRSVDWVQLTFSEDSTVSNHTVEECIPDDWEIQSFCHYDHSSRLSVDVVPVDR